MGPGRMFRNTATMTTMRNALKALGAVVAVVVLCAPLMLMPNDEPQPVLGYAGVTITVPPTVVVPTTIPGLETTTTTTEAPPPSRAETAPSTTTTTAPIDVTIAAAGTILAPQEVLDSVRDPVTNSYDFAPVFAPIAPYLAGADYAVASLGPRLAGPDAGHGDSPAPNAPRELAFALKQAGVDLVGTANAHSLDLGWDGIKGTLDRLDAAGLAHVGTARSSEERSTPVIVDIRGIKVAFLDYTASLTETVVGTGDSATDTSTNGASTTVTTAAGGTASKETDTTKPVATTHAADKEAAPNTTTSGTTTTTATTTPVPPEQAAFTVNRLDPEVVRQDAMMARSWGADIVIAMLDYGKTDQQKPDSEQVAVSEDILYNGGVDVILGSNPGIVQTISHMFTYTNFRDTYVAYSLGDFLAAPSPDKPESGLIAYLHLQKRGLRTYVTGISYLPVYMQVSTSEQGTGSTDGGDNPVSTTGTSAQDPAFSSGSGPAASTTTATSPSTSTSTTTVNGTGAGVSGTTAVSSSTTGSSANPDARAGVAAYRVLPVLPGLDPATDIPLSLEDKQRMQMIWENLRSLLYRPDERISPLSTGDLGQ
jgi:poly-gamma-glutamate capsule biosynthesis protein CapA/YwtB (metallophosphatase superfamily)